MIEIIDAAYCKVTDRSLYEAVREILSYKSEYWTEGRFHKERHVSTASFFDRKTGEFPKGFLRRVLEELERKKLIDPTADWLRELETPQYFFEEPRLRDITLRSDQYEMLQGLSNLHRGYFKAPTGSGKTILALAIRSMMPDSKTLILTHTIDLLTQTVQEFRRFGANTYEVGGGRKEIPDLQRGDVVVAMVQTFINLPDIIDYKDTFDIVIIDECHHVTDTTGRHANILKVIGSKLRVGLTATVPKDPKKLMALEGFIGPMLGEFTVKEAIEKGVISKPEIEWISVPQQDDLLDITKYRKLYEKAIVTGRTRNRLVIEAAIRHIDQDRSVLIVVKEVEHGKILRQLAEALGLQARFISGDTSSKIRADLKQALEEKQVYCVIATIWKEGVNIKSLDVVINAAGGMSEIATLQSIGRALRVTETKKKITIIDFVDAYRYLNHHAIMRLRTYVENEWAMHGTATQK